MKTCPSCAESIQDAAIVCRHCQRSVTGAPPVVRLDQNWLGLFGWGFSIVTGLILLGYLGSCT